MAVDAQTRADDCSSTLGDDVGELGGQHAAVGVAQHVDVGAGLRGDTQHLERVRRVAAVAVEEVLGVEEDPLALRAQVRDGVAHHREVLLAGWCAGPARRAGRGSSRPGVTTGAPTRAARRPGGRRRRFTPGRRVAPNAASWACCRSSSVGRARKNSVSLGFAPGQPPSMKPDAEVVEVPGDGELVGDREGEALLLRAVAQRRVVDVERVGRADRRSLTTSGAVACSAIGLSKQKDPSRVREVCASADRRRARA